MSHFIETRIRVNASLDTIAKTIISEMYQRNAFLMQTVHLLLLLHQMYLVTRFAHV